MLEVNYTIIDYFPFYQYIALLELFTTKTMEFKGIVLGSKIYM